QHVLGIEVADEVREAKQPIHNVLVGRTVKLLGIDEAVVLDHVERATHLGIGEHRRVKLFEEGRLLHPIIAAHLAVGKQDSSNCRKQQACADDLADRDVGRKVEHSTSSTKEPQQSELYAMSTASNASIT